MTDIIARLEHDQRYTRGHVPVTMDHAAKEIARLRAALRPFAEIGLMRDADKRAPDMIDAPDLAISPEHVRAARRALGGDVYG